MLMKINVAGIRREEKLQYLVTYSLKTISCYVKRWDAMERHSQTSINFNEPKKNSFPRIGQLE